MNGFFGAIFATLFSFTALSQNANSHFESDYFEHQRFAHRGGYAIGPENTIPTILKSIEGGVKAVEIDVRLTSDGHLVLFHDETVERVLQEDQPLVVGDFTLEKFLNTPLRDTTTGIVYPCSLEQVIDTLISLTDADSTYDFLLEIDFKPNGDETKTAVEELLKIVDARQKIVGDRIYNYFFVSTFYPDVLKELHTRKTPVQVAFAFNSSPSSSRLKAKIGMWLAPCFARKFEIDIIEPNMCKVDKRFVKKWHKKEILINAYTANSACEKAALEALGVAYTTNCPLSESCSTDASDEPGKPTKWCKKCRNSEK